MQWPSLEPTKVPIRRVKSNGSSIFVSTRSFWQNLVNIQ